MSVKLLQHHKIRASFLAAATVLLLFGSIAGSASGRTIVRGYNGVVASSSAIASQVGVDILSRLMDRGRRMTDREHDGVDLGAGQRDRLVLG